MSALGDVGRVVDWKGDQYARSLRRAAGAGLRRAAKAEERRLKAKLSGPAGSPEGGPPGKESGQLAGTIGSRVRTTRAFATATIGVLNDTEAMAYAARLAGGFVGRDRLGRFYSQGPRPWLDVDEPGVFAAAVAEMQKARV